MRRNLKDIKTYEIFPIIKYKYDELLKIKQNKTIVITFKLTVNGKDVGEKPKVTGLKRMTSIYWVCFTAIALLL